MNTTIGTAPRIAHLIWSFTTGGIECRLVDQLNARPGGSEQHLIIVNYHIDETLLSGLNPDVHVHKLMRRRGSRSPVPLLRLNLLLEKLNPDIVVCHVASLARCLVMKPRRLVLHLHNVHESLRPVAKHYDAHMAISNEVGRYIREQIPASKPVVIYDGVNNDRVLPREETAAGDVFRIVQIGRLETIKGQDVLLRALAVLRHQRPDFQFHAHFMGSGSQMQAYEKLSTELGLNGHVNFLGRVDPDFIHENLCRYDLLVLPSRSEGLGDVAIEAAFARVPVLTAALPGPMEIIDDGDCGWAFRPEDPADCATGILDVAEAYRTGNVGGFVERAFIRAEEKFSLAVAADRLAEFYGKTAGRLQPDGIRPSALEQRSCESC